MPDNKLVKRVSVSFSQIEYDDLRALAYASHAKKEINRGVSSLLRDVALHFISKNRRLLSQLSLFRYQINSRSQCFKYQKIREAFEAIRNIQNNALKKALTEEEGIINASKN